MDRRKERRQVATDRILKECKGSHFFKSLSQKMYQYTVRCGSHIRKKNRTIQATLPDSVAMREKAQRKWHSFFFFKW